MNLIISDCPTNDEVAFSTLGDIDRIGEAFCESAQNTERVHAIQQYRTFRMRCIEKTLSILDACGVPERSIVSVRLKRLDSIRRKIERPGTNFTLGRLDDIVGVRVICQELSAIAELNDRIRSSSWIFRTKDYISKPSSTGYRGIHHIMRFEQPLNDASSVSVRYEIQTRTFFQHQWSVWSESKGEAVKLGLGEEEEQERLRSLSDNIAVWETNNPQKVQITLPKYSGGKSVAVCWRTRHGPAMLYFFQNNVRDAVNWLNYLEILYPKDRANALLLVGITEADKTENALRLTHPLYMKVRVTDPRFWMPKTS